MSLERKIRELDVSLIVAPNAYFDGFSSAKHQAATLAAEADELMREMGNALAMIDPEQLDPVQDDDVQSALSKYKTWKEQNQ